MAKFTVEVELDWLREGETIDEAMYEQVVSGIQERLIENVESRANEQMEEKLNEKIEEYVDSFIEKITNEKLKNIEIPHKTSSWGSEVEMIPISEFIGKRFERAVTEKILTESGGKPNYRSDAKYSIVEYLTKGYIADELNERVIDMIQEAKSQAEETLIASLEENLQQQLNADMLQRLNIPALLEKLQDTITIEE